MEKLEKDEKNTGLFDELISFENLGVCQELCEACSKLNYKNPTKIQKESLPYTLQGRDLIGLAETGSGKTLAFVLPILQDILKKPQPFFACIIAPTRELCVQIHDVFEALGAGISLKTVVIVGGLDHMTQAAAIAKKPHIVIATPGRLLYHLENTKGFNLEALKYFVMDEADKLLNSDFEKAIDKILPFLPKKRHTYLFSATMTNKVSKLQRASLHDPVKVEVSTKNQTVSTLNQSFVFMPSKYKNAYLIYFLTEYSGNTIIIFTATCANAMLLTLISRNLGFHSVAIHGNMTQVKRLSALNKFKGKEKNILIATDVASRGLDIPNVDLVINYDTPQSSKDYVHRVGRTARAGKSGIAICLVTQYDVEDFLRIEKFIGKKVEEKKIEEEQALIFYERVQEAERLAGQELKNLVEKTKEKTFGKVDSDSNFAKMKGAHGPSELNSNKKKKMLNQKNFKKRVKIDIQDERIDWRMKSK